MNPSTRDFGELCYLRCWNFDVRYTEYRVTISRGDLGGVSFESGKDNSEAKIKLDSWIKQIREGSKPCSF